MIYYPYLKTSLYPGVAPMVWSRCRDNENAEAKNRIGGKDRSDGEGDFVDGDSLPSADGGVRMSYRIFISSVQREFAKERKALADYIRKDAILGKFFEVFLFEEVPAQERSASEVYLGEVDKCDIYLGILGASYGNTNAKGVSATEQEYNRAAAKKKTRICFVKRGVNAEQPQKKFIGRVNADVVRSGFAGFDELRKSVYAALAEFLVSKNMINVLPFDASRSAGIKLKDISTEKIRQFVRDARQYRDWSLSPDASPMAVLDALDLVDEQGRILNPAVLLFGKRPQHFFPCSEVKCAWFLTDHVEKPIEDHKIFRGDVFEMVDEATRFVMSHLNFWVGKRDVGETAQAPTKFEIPRDAVKEAIVNAVCHRDYTSNASVQVMLFSNRLEVWSPGPLPKGMTIDKFYRRHKSYPANPLLAYAMFMRKYIEKSGTGAGDMIKMCRDAGVPSPKWQVEDGDDFIVTIPRPKANRDALQKVSRTAVLGHDQENVLENDLEKSIVELLREEPKSSFASMAAVFHRSAKTIQRAIEALKAQGVIRRVGPDKGGRWEVVNQISKSESKTKVKAR